MYYRIKTYYYNRKERIILMEENFNKEELRKRLFNTVDILEKNNITYWLDFGTLLGAYRDGKIIEQDYDIDIGILHKDLERVKQLRTEKINDGGKYLIPFCEYVDIFSYIEKENKLICPDYFGSVDDSGFPKKWIDTMIKIKMYNRLFFVPSNVSEYLIIKYGIDFDVSSKDRINEHVSIVRGGDTVKLFNISDIQWHKSIIRFQLKQKPLLECEVQFRENDLDGNIFYSHKISWVNYSLFWFKSNKKFKNFHTFFVRINQGDKILFFQKIVCSTDLRTFNMYKFLLDNKERQNV